MATSNARRLNSLAESISASTYLEIGVHMGKTLADVEVANKVGVDPTFRFDIDDLAFQGTELHEVTSDHYFSALAREGTTFDLILLDGLHTFDQTFRDFCASLAHAHADTVWLIDDTSPSSRLAAYPNPRVTRKLRTLLRSSGEAWMGDVFKVVFAIHDFFPQFSFATFPEHGGTVVWRETREDFAPTWGSLKAIGSLRYRDFLRYRDSHLRVLPPARILDSVRSRNDGGEII